MIRIKFFIISITLLIFSNVMAQVTSLEVDNQSPGWLSSKIGYQDQQTVENLTISGYLNGDDMKFINSLLVNQKVKILDLSEVNIVAGGSGNFKTSDGNFLINQIGYNLSKSNHLRKLITPKYCSATHSVNAWIADSIIYNGTEKWIKAMSQPEYSADSSPIPYCLYFEFANQIESINFNRCKIHNTSNSYGYYTGGTIVFPESIKTINYLYFQKGVIVMYSDNPSNIKLYECNFKSGTLYVPLGTKELYENSAFKSMEIIEMMPPSEIKLDKNHIQLYKEEKALLSATIIPEKAFFRDLIWSTSNQNVASVSNYGELTAKESGTANIIVSSKENDIISDTCEVVVYEHASGVRLSQNVISINLGNNYILEANTLPLGKTDNQIVWTSTNDAIASVDENGKVFAKGLGVCKIIAKSVDGGFEAECVVTVVQPAYRVYVDKKLLTINTGENATLKATVSPDNTTDKTVLWTSRDTAIAKVDSSGVVTGKKAGKVYIVATAASNPEAKDSCEVTVLQPVTGITMSQEELTFTEIGQTKQLKATVSPDDASNKAVRWRSFNENVCSVSESGYVVAVGYGSAVITATSVDGGFVGTCICKVIEKAPDPIMGDVDNNREVNVLDIVKTVDYIMKRPIDNFYVSLADFDGDEKITVADLVEIVSIVSSQSQINGMVAASNIGSGKVCMTTNDDGTLSLGVKDSRMYIATQMVVELSDNQRLVDVSSIDGHNVVFRNIGGNRYSVISYSNQNNVYESSDRMINLAITGDGFVNVESVLAVDVDRRSVVFENNDVEYVTGIAEITVDFNQPTDIYTVGGVLIKRNATSTEGLPKGMYIINNKKYYKK